MDMLTDAGTDYRPATDWLTDAPWTSDTYIPHLALGAHSRDDIRGRWGWPILARSEGQTEVVGWLHGWPADVTIAAGEAALSNAALRLAADARAV